MKHLSVEIREGIAEITLRRPKVNAMNTALLGELEEAFSNADANDEVNGALLVGEGPCLSAGLDLAEVASLDRGGAEAFLSLVGRAFEAAFRFSKPLAVAVEGHAVAGGLVVAMCGDFIAFQQGDYKVGLTELAVGVPFPRIAWEAVRLGMPPRALRKLVYEAGTYTPAAVFQLGVGDVLEADARGAAASWLALVTSRPLETFQVVKALHRKEAWDRIDKHLEGGPAAAAEHERLVSTLLATRQTAGHAPRT